jgi:small subunit ribosomal protein S8e
MGISRDKLHKRRATGGRRKVIRGKRKFELGRAPALTKLGEKRIHLVRTRGGHSKHRALRLNEGHFVWPGEAATKRSRILNVVYNATSNELVRTNTLVKGCIVQIDATPFKQWYETFYRVQIGKTTKKEEEGKKDAKKTDKPADKKATDKTPAADAAKKDDKAAAPAKKDDKAPAKKDDKAPAKKDDKAAAPAKKDDKAAAPAKKDDKAPAKKADKKKKADAKGEKPADTGAPKKPSHHLQRKFNARNKARILEQSLKDQFNTGRVLAKIASRPGQSGRADGYILEGEELAFYLKKITKKN